MTEEEPPKPPPDEDESKPPIKDPPTEEPPVKEPPPRIVHSGKQSEVSRGGMLPNILPAENLFSRWRVQLWTWWDCIESFVRHAYR